MNTSSWWLRPLVNDDAWIYDPLSSFPNRLIGSTWQILRGLTIDQPFDGSPGLQLDDSGVPKIDLYIALAVCFSYHPLHAHVTVAYPAIVGDVNHHGNCFVSPNRLGFRQQDRLQVRTVLDRWDQISWKQTYSPSFTRQTRTLLMRKLHPTRSSISFHVPLW